MSPTIDDGIVTGITMGSITLVIGIGQFLVQQAFYKPVTVEAVSFPIILRPYRWMLVIAHVLCGAFMVMGLGLIIFAPGIAGRFIGGAIIVVSFLMWVGAFQEAGEYLLIDSDGFKYVKSPSKFIEIKGSQITSFLASPIGGNLIVRIYGKDKRVLIPLTFHNISFLRQQMERWAREEHIKSFKNWRPKEVN